MSCFKYGHKPHFSDAKIVGFYILCNCVQQKVCFPPCPHTQKRHATWDLCRALRAVQRKFSSDCALFLFYERLLAVHNVETGLETLQGLSVAANTNTA